MPWIPPAFLPRNGAESASMDTLRALVRGLERPFANAPICSLGDPRLDAALPGGGLPLGRMHEIIAPAGDAGLGLALVLLGRLAGGSGTALWCGQGFGPGLYGPGLAAFGLDPDRLIFARARTDAEALWAMEEALRCKALAAVAGEVAALDLTAGRRLQLAAERHGVTAIVLRRPRRDADKAARAPGAAATRWRASPLPAPAGLARWRVKLLRCRGGTPRDFILDWNHATGDLVVAGAPSDGFGAAGLDAAD